MDNLKKKKKKKINNNKVNMPLLGDTVMWILSQRSINFTVILNHN